MMEDRGWRRDEDAALAARRDPHDHRLHSLFPCRIGHMKFNSMLTLCQISIPKHLSSAIWKSVYSAEYPIYIRLPKCNQVFALRRIWPLKKLELALCYSCGPLGIGDRSTI